MFDSIGAAFDVGRTIIEKIWPDPVKQAEELRKLEELRQNGDIAQLNAHVQLMLGQMEINKVEAGHKSIFVAGWRPFIGWTGGAAMAYQFVLYPLLLWIWVIAQAKGWIPMYVESIDEAGEIVRIALNPPPMLETSALFSIVTGMLGVGAMRSYDKKNKVQTDALGKN